MFTPTHFGLYFSAEAVKKAHDNAEREPLKSAWARLRETNPLEPLSSAQWNGLRYRFDANTQAGEFTVSILMEHLTKSTDDTPYWHSVAETLLLAQCIELIRDHPATTPALKAHWRDLIFERTGALNQLTYDASIAESLWMNTLNMATGIVLEREPIFQDSVAYFKAIIDEEIHPEGYLPKAIDPESGGQSLLNHLRISEALVLMAEMARCIDVDLWRYSNRGVSLTTATTYPLYYYFYPEKWKWVEERYIGGKKVEAEVLDIDETQQMFKKNSGYLEMLNAHYGTSPLKAIRMILDEVRPVNDLYAGGLTTLTHGVTEGRRGLFG